MTVFNRGCGERDSNTRNEFGCDTGSSVQLRRIADLEQENEHE